MEESKKQITPDRFPCTSCGLCCKNITGIIELIGFDVGNGVCKFLDLETNLCKIYESRPLICRIDEAHKKLYPHIPLKDFYANAPLVGFAVKISPGLLSLLGLMLAMGCASFWI
ncbi:YkgJ family cysteine cluster protein [Helicobacter pylori]|uniref:YkgJ family cysteine cluster protein n=1 Tax=Helicobacter pylori TaxID=210 RepID=UPI001F08EDEF|nr:YkgJ family cysteine cluster protein [Helicobacter pylori]